jgi:hypothetical protein
MAQNSIQEAMSQIKTREEDLVQVTARLMLALEKIREVSTFSCNIYLHVLTREEDLAHVTARLMSALEKIREVNINAFACTHICTFASHYSPNVGIRENSRDKADCV